MGWLIALALGVGSVYLLTSDDGSRLADVFRSPAEGRSWRVLRESTIDWVAHAAKLGQDPGAALVGQTVILRVASKVPGDGATSYPLAVFVDRQVGPFAFDGRVVALPDVPVPPRIGPKAGTSIAFTLADAFGLAS